MVKIITVYGNMLLTAMGRTLLLAFLGLFFACILGMIFGLLSVLKNKACNIISNIFVFVIRGVPMIVLAFFIYFGIPYLINNILGVFALSLSVSSSLAFRFLFFHAPFPILSFSIPCSSGSFVPFRLLRWELLSSGLVTPAFPLFHLCLEELLEGFSVVK